MTVDEQTLERVVEFHGHMCPGLALGVRAAEVALAEIGPHSQDEEVVAIVETDMCGVDAVQFLTGCTFGKGNLVHRDYGKNVYTFVRRSDGRAIRVSGRPDALVSGPPEWEEVFARVRTGTATADDQRRFWDIQQQRSQGILRAPLDQLYDVREVQVSAPPTARVMASVVCAACGEATMETRIRRLEGLDLCPPCFEAALARHQH